MQDIRKTIGNLIKQGRKIKKLKQTELAELVDVDPKYISRIETGMSYASLSVIEKIFNVLDINLNETISSLAEYDKKALLNAISNNIKNLSLKKLKVLDSLVKVLIENN